MGHFLTDQQKARKPVVKRVKRPDTKTGTFGAIMGLLISKLYIKQSLHFTEGY